MNRCNISCAHKDDVHDCETCRPHVAFTCHPICKPCADKGGACTCNLQIFPCKEDQVPGIEENF